MFLYKQYRLTLCYVLLHLKCFFKHFTKLKSITNIVQVLAGKLTISRRPVINEKTK